jgi:hypothetical protein
LWRSSTSRFISNVATHVPSVSAPTAKSNFTECMEVEWKLF